VTLRLLVVDAYDRAGRAALRRAGATEAGALYARLLRAIEPDARVDVVHPADADAALPPGTTPGDYDGVVWTGSSLSVVAHESPPVRRQVELARRVYRSGVPSFGSCYAAQLAVVAAGGACRPSPRGREFGVGRAIELTDAGRGHPLFAGKPTVFQAWTCHADEIATLPAGARRRAGNAWSEFQAVEVTAGPGVFWAVQYHPEYDPGEVARLCELRADELVAQGTFRDAEAALRVRDVLDALQREPSRADLAGALDVEPALLDAELRTRELRNWLDGLVKGRARR
jgi:GMP synthase (glutamine-hydrolysing)